MQNMFPFVLIPSLNDLHSLFASVLNLYYCMVNFRKRQIDIFILEKKPLHFMPLETICMKYQINAKQIAFGNKEQIAD